MGIRETIGSDSLDRKTPGTSGLGKRLGDGRFNQKIPGTNQTTEQLRGTKNPSIIPVIRRPVKKTR